MRKLTALAATLCFVFGVVYCVAEPLNKMEEDGFELECPAGAITYFRGQWWSGHGKCPINGSAGPLKAGGSITVRDQGCDKWTRFSDGASYRSYELTYQPFSPGESVSVRVIQAGGGAADIYQFHCTVNPLTEPLDFPPLRCNSSGLKRWPLTPSPENKLAATKVELSTTDRGAVSGINVKFSEPILFADHSENAEPIALKCDGNLPPQQGRWASCSEWHYEFEPAAMALTSANFKCSVELKTPLNTVSGKKINAGVVGSVEIKHAPTVGAARFFGKDAGVGDRPFILVYLRGPIAAGKEPKQLTLKEVPRSMEYHWARRSLSSGKRPFVAKAPPVELRFNSAVTSNQEVIETTAKAAEQEDGLGGMYSGRFVEMAKGAAAVLKYDVPADFDRGHVLYGLEWPKGVEGASGLNTEFKTIVPLNDNGFWQPLDIQTP